MNKNNFTLFLVCKGLSNDGAGVARGSVRYGRDLASKPAILSRKIGGRGRLRTIRPESVNAEIPDMHP